MATRVPIILLPSVHVAEGIGLGLTLLNSGQPHQGRLQRFLLPEKEHKPENSKINFEVLWWNCSKMVCTAFNRFEKVIQQSENKQILKLSKESISQFRQFNYFDISWILKWTNKINETWIAQGNSLEWEVAILKLAEKSILFAFTFLFQNWTFGDIIRFQIQLNKQIDLQGSPDS